MIKEGIYEDFERRDKLLALSRFSTTLGEKRALKQYVADLKPNQTEIYFLVGDSIERLKSNPRLEAASARGIEVLLLTDAVDAFWTSAQLEFEGKPLKSLSQGDLNLDLIPLVDEKAKDKSEPAADEAKTIAVIKASLGDRVTDVRASTRLTTSASCLVAVTAPTASWSGCCCSKIEGPGPNRSLRSTCAIRWWPRSPRRAPRQKRPTICRYCCSNRRKSLTVNCPRILQRSPRDLIGWCCRGWRRASLPS